MDEQRLQTEAQLIAERFNFWLPEGVYDHLQGYIYESPDGAAKYAIEIKYGEDFPQNPPEIYFLDEIPNLSGEIELESLTNWNENSHVVEIVAELNKIITDALQGAGASSKTAIPMSSNGGTSQGSVNNSGDSSASIPPAGGVSEPSTPAAPSTSSTPAMPSNSSTPTTAPAASSAQSATPAPSSAPLQEEPSSAEIEEEYITPDLTSYPDDIQMATNGAQNMPSWSEQDFVTPGEPDVDAYINQAGSSVPGSDNAPQGNVSQNSADTGPPVSNEQNSSKSEMLPDSYFVTDETDLRVSEESALIQQEYAMDYIDGNIGKVEIYLTITIEQTFIIKVDFTNFPKRPVLEVSKSITKLLGDLNNTLQVLNKWDESKPPHVVEIIRELESKLWFLSDIELESKKIAGEYKVELIDGIITNLKVSFFTYGFKEYTLDINISKFPAQPEIKLSKELEELINVPIENLKAYSGWKRKESQPVDILREIQWLIDKNSRINFELNLLKGGIKSVEFIEQSSMIKAKLAGQMKTKDLSFDFEVTLPRDYPMGTPKIELKTDLEGQEDIKDNLMSHIKTFTDSWNPFNYLIDLFNKINKAIFEVSVVSCVICHSIECPTCHLKISAPEGEEQCQVMCPHCERLYHKHCWDQTIISFGKCGFCLRPPPPNMIPK